MENSKPSVFLPSTQVFIQPSQLQLVSQIMQFSQ